MDFVNFVVLNQGLNLRYRVQIAMVDMTYPFKMTKVITRYGGQIAIVDTAQPL